MKNSNFIKKLTSLILSLCLIAAIGLSLTSCGEKETPQESRVLFGLCFKNKDNVDKLHREAEGFNPISGT